METRLSPARRPSSATVQHQCSAVVTDTPVVTGTPGLTGLRCRGLAEAYAQFIRALWAAGWPLIGSVLAESKWTGPDVEIRKDC
jgi:hypothetical protein